ncbi:MAG: FAD-dependent oxidoreductase, partial [Hafnia sp.]
FTIRGMDMAIASGEAAARAVLEAKTNNDFSERGLSGYLKLLEELPVMKALRHYRKVPAMLENPRMFTQYPQMVANIMADMFTVNGQPPQPMRKMIMRHCKEIGYLNLLKDGIKGVTAL